MRPFRCSIWAGFLKRVSCRSMFAGRWRSRAWLLGFGSKASVLELEALRHKIAGELRAAAARYDAEEKTSAPDPLPSISTV